MAKEKKAAKHEERGDAHFSKGKFEKALKEYKKALESEPDSAEILDKLTKTQAEIPGDWGMEEFADSVGWAMKKQEKEHPPIKQVHARLSPEWKEATGLALAILNEENEARRGDMIETLAAMGEIATRAMIGLLIDIRNPPPEDLQQQDDAEPKP